VRALPWPVALIVFAVPLLVRTLKAFNQPKPAQPPADYPVWPLWWAPLAFLHTRRAGGLLIGGLLAWLLWQAVV
jgi:1,4-dihydroxy-2-naphthoate octaprenyltransferase